jgi:BirA family biotin operon repressor/biotin-[acetyl-CoA-carboxylase] ligase
VNDTSDRILAALGSGNEWVSSARMVRELGVSRMAVCKQIRRLRGLGYGIEASPRRGYRLTARTDRAVPEEVAPLLRTRLVGRPCRHLSAIDSTNAFLRRHMQEFPDGTAVTADTQTHGRGRLHREWFSPPGVNVYLSVLLKPAVSPLLAPQLSLVAAAAALRALHAEGCAEAGVKWPNDILWRGRKLAGILCEMDAEADLIHAVVVGIGVNVNLTMFPAALRPTAASLCVALGRSVSVPRLTAEILNRLDDEYANWLRDGLPRTVRFLNRHSVLSGREVGIALPRERIRGRAERITDSGMLRVIRPDGRARDIASGEVHLCRAKGLSLQANEDPQNRRTG